MWQHQGWTAQAPAQGYQGPEQWHAQEWQQAEWQQADWQQQEWYQHQHSPPMGQHVDPEYAEMDRRAQDIANDRVPYEMPPAMRAAAVASLKEEILWQMQQQAAANSSESWGRGGGGQQFTVPPGDHFELLGDVPWFPHPKIKAWGQGSAQQWRGASSQVPARKAEGGELDEPLAAEAEEDFASQMQQMQDQEEESEEAIIIRRLTGALGGEIEEAGQERQRGLFAESTRMLLAVLGFAGEGNVPPMLRHHVVATAHQSPFWQGFSPRELLQQWSETTMLLSLLCTETLRKAFDAAPRSQRAQFLAMISRAAYLEVNQRAAVQGKALRPVWQQVFDAFPEVKFYRALLGHIRQKCWEDVRDRSRSRSRSRERRKKEQSQNQKPKADHTIRFFVKNTGSLPETELETHFSQFGKVKACNVLMDKKTKKSRGMAFVTLAPQGFYETASAALSMMRSWVLEASHNVKGTFLEVTEADAKPEEDEERKREERVEERRRLRVEREQRALRVAAVVPAAEKVEEKFMPSLWARRWRKDFWEALPKGTYGPTPWTDNRVASLCSIAWREAAESARRTGDTEVRIALGLFEADATDRKRSPESAPRWAFVPAADLMLIVCEGMVGITANGVFMTPGWLDPTPFPSFASAGLLAMDTISANAPLSTPQAPQISHHFSMAGSHPGVGGLAKGHNDSEKIFVGGLSHSTTLDMLMHYFSRYGTITDAVVMMDKVTGKPRGFGFVVFESIDMVERVLAENGKHRLDGKWVDVKRATPLHPDTPTRASGAGGGMPPPPPAPPQQQVHADHFIQAEGGGFDQPTGSSSGVRSPVDSSPPFTAVPPPVSVNIPPPAVLDAGAGPEQGLRTFAERKLEQESPVAPAQAVGSFFHPPAPATGDEAYDPLAELG